MGQLVSDVTSIINDKKSKADADNERKSVLQQISDDEKTKTDLVKKALSTQRAKYGAGGMSGASMTTDAVLKRLREETEQPYDEKKKSNLEKLRKIKSTKTNLLKSLSDRFDELMG